MSERDRYEGLTEAERVLADAVTRASAGLDDVSKRRLRRDVLARIGDAGAPVWARRTFQRAAAVAAITTTLVSGASYAAAVSLPGDALYDVKTLSEEVALAVLPEGDLRDGVRERIAARRASEVRALVAEGADPALIEEAVRAFESAAQRAWQGTAGRSGVLQMTASGRRVMSAIDDMPEPLRERLQAALRAEEENAGAGSAGTGGDAGTGAGGTGGTGGTSDTDAPSGQSPGPGPGPGGEPDSNGSGTMQPDGSSGRR
ncbi:MAG: hypothetical protein Kow0067_15720 [Coriobacteriia bacterium]